MKNSNIVISEGKQITIVNMNDIEDIILAKSQIDNDDSSVKYRSNLTDFMNKYCQLDTILTNGAEKTMPFSIVDLFGKSYLFCSYENEDEKDVLINFLNKIQFDINKLKKLSYLEMINGLDKMFENDELYIIKDNNYWFIKN